jgi:hypothetical protein
MDKSRIDGCAPEKLSPFYAELKVLLDRHQYPPSNIFNMDETGIAIGTTQSSRVIAFTECERGQPKAKKAWKAGSTRGEWMTTIECVSASGIALPPLVILKGTTSFNARNLPHEVDLDLVQDWKWTTSTKGWSSDYLGIQWLVQVFLPQTQHLQGRRLLILDGHGSHVKAQFIARCMGHDVDLMVLPSHSSHKTQPLDVGIFQPLKKAMAKMTDQIARHAVGNSTPKWVWIANLAKARKQAFTTANIAVGWKETGIQPFRPTKIIRLLTPPPESPSRQPHSSQTPLPSLASDTQALLSEYPLPHTPGKRKLIDHLSNLVTTAERAQARAVFAENELREIHQARENAKRPRNGVNVTNMGTHVFSSQEILGQITGLEYGRIFKSRKGKERAIDQTETQEELGDGADMPLEGYDDDENPFL